MRLIHKYIKILKYAKGLVELESSQELHRVQFTFRDPIKNTVNLLLTAWSQKNLMKAWNTLSAIASSITLKTHLIIPMPFFNSYIFWKQPDSYIRIQIISLGKQIKQGKQSYVHAQTAAPVGFWWLLTQKEDQQRAHMLFSVHSK